MLECNQYFKNSQQDSHRKYLCLVNYLSLGAGEETQTPGLFLGKEA